MNSLLKPEGAKHQSISDIDDFLNLVSGHLPENYQVEIHVENGAANVLLWKWISGHGYKQRITLPDSADKSLQQQISEAVCVANNWIIENEPIGTPSP